MQKVNEAKKILTNSQKRRIYDIYGFEGIKSGMTTEPFPYEHRRIVQGTDIKHVLKSQENLFILLILF
jgi:DnaJ-class molecular chaperone